MSGWSSGFALVAAGGVECSGAYEVMVDEDGVVGVVVVGFGLVSGPGGADADEVAAGGGDAVGSDDADGALRRCGERDAEVDRWWCGRPPFGGGDASDPTVGSLVVVVVDERVELGLQLGDVLGEGLAAQPFLERLLEPFDLAAGLGMTGPRCLGDHPDFAELDFEVDLETAQLP